MMRKVDQEQNQTLSKYTFVQIISSTSKVFLLTNNIHLNLIRNSKIKISQDSFITYEWNAYLRPRLTHRNFMF